GLSGAGAARRGAGEPERLLGRELPAVLADERQLAGRDRLQARLLLEGTATHLLAGDAHLAGGLGRAPRLLLRLPAAAALPAALLLLAHCSAPTARRGGSPAVVPSFLLPVRPWGAAPSRYRPYLLMYCTTPSGTRYKTGWPA